MTAHPTDHAAQTSAPQTKRVLVYCGSRTPLGAQGEPYLRAAAAFGAAVARRGWGIVYGGHHAGMMGAVANGCMGAGGPVTGILPAELVGKEIPPDGIELIRVADMHTRKALMVERADAITALPGGFGTLDELFEQLTWRAIDKHDKPLGLFDVTFEGRSFWGPLLSFLDHTVDVGFIPAEGRALLRSFTDPSDLCCHLGLPDVPDPEMSPPLTARR
jgi:uncharacterized protein (TIGR00730 family)